MSTPVCTAIGYLSCVLLLGCQNDFVLAPDHALALEVTTDQTSYLAVPDGPPESAFRSWRFQMISTIRNTGKGTVMLRGYYHRPLVGLEIVPPAERNGYARTITLQGEPPLLLHPGESYTDTTMVSGPGGRNQGEPLDERGLDGEYRVIYALHRCDDNPVCEARWQAIWPVITVQRADN